MARGRRAGTRAGKEGLQNASAPQGTGGMRSEVDLINGLPPRQSPDADRGGLPIMGRRRREARKRAVAIKSEEPPPGKDGG